VETTTEFAFLAAEKDGSLLTLVIAASLLALALFVPAVIMAAWRACRTLRRPDALWSQPAQQASAVDHAVRRAPSETDVLDCEWPSPIDSHRQHNGRALEEQSLWQWLDHPASASRMLAIDRLAETGSSSTIRKFRERLDVEREDCVVAEIVRALARIGGREARELILRLKSHTSATVREAAERAFAETIRTRDEGKTPDEVVSRDEMRLG